MILNYRNQGKDEERFAQGKCLVDGVEIRLAFYVDTEAGVVLSYDAFGDATFHQLSEQAIRDRWADWYSTGLRATDDGLIYKTVTGKVDLIART